MRHRLTVFALVLMVAVTACGGDDDDSGAAGDVDRYCALTGELDAAGEEAFADLEQREDATEEDFAAAEASFLAEHEDELTELAEAAPEEIRADAEMVLDAMRRFAEGESDARDSAEVQAADERVNAFEEERCGQD